MRALIALMLFVLSSAPAVAQVETAVQRFDSANELLASGRYAEAVDVLQSVKTAGFENPAVHYNLGIAYYRMDRLGEAVRAFERARRLDPEDRRIIHNLQMVRARIEDQFSSLPTPVWTRVWQRTVTMLGPMGLFLIGLLGYLAVIGLVSFRLLRDRRTPWLRRGIWAGAAVAIVGLAGGFGASTNPPFGDQAVVLAESVRLREQAGTEAASVVEIHEGLTVDVTAREGTWTRVRLPNGTDGWVESSVLGEI